MNTWVAVTLGALTCVFMMIAIIALLSWSIKQAFGEFDR